MRKIRMVCFFAAACVCGMSVPGIVSGQELKKQEAQNVVFIIIDALRPDHLGCYGYRFNTSPAIDVLARESVVFENAFSQSCYTIASHASMFTSLYPKSHGMFEVFKDVFPKRVTMMAELFKNKGLATAWFSILDQPHLDISIGFGRGYDFTGDLGPRLEEREDLFDWIRQNKDKPFFLAMNARSVHDPYSPDPSYRKKMERGSKRKIISTEDELDRGVFRTIQAFARKSLPERVRVTHKDVLYGPYKKGRIDVIADLLPPAKKLELINMRRGFYFSRIDLKDKNNMEYLRSLYDACILETDQKLISSLVALLKELGIYDNTCIVITSDHGEEFGEHGGLGHNFQLYDELVHVPLIMKIPGYAGQKRIKQLVQSIDILPTLCGYFGIIPPAYIQGKDLSGLLKSDKPLPVHQYVYGENPKEMYIRSEEWKLIVPHNPNGQRYLYNVKQDPAEKNNVYALDSSADIRKQMEPALQEQRHSLPLYQEGENYFLPEIPPEMRERIKKTGYW